MLNIHKFQSGYELFTTLCIVWDSDLAGIYEYLTSSRGSYCKNESIVIVISGNWEYETGLSGLGVFQSKFLFFNIILRLNLFHKRSRNYDVNTKQLSTSEFVYKFQNTA